MSPQKKLFLSAMLAFFALAFVIPGGSLFLFLFSLAVSAQAFPLGQHNTPWSFLRWLLLVWLIPSVVIASFCEHCSVLGVLAVGAGVGLWMSKSKAR